MPWPEDMVRPVRVLRFHRRTEPSRPADISVCPSVPNTRSLIPLTCPRSTAPSFRLRRSQRKIGDGRLSSSGRTPEARYLPSNENRTTSTQPAYGLAESTTRPLDTLQTVTVPVSVPAAINLLSGEQLRAMTCPLTGLWVGV